MRILACMLVAAAAAGCRERPALEPRSSPEGPSLESAAAAYRARRALDTLEAVVARLEPGLARAEVERLLGEADGWDDPSVFYRSDRANLAGERLGLTLDFYLWYVDGRPSVPSDRLERWVLASGNRFESADPQIPKREDPPPASERPDPPPAAHYRRHRDYASLQALVRWLRLGTPRRGVEALLGTPDHCSHGGLPCYYASQRKNAAGLPLGVLVDYRVHNVAGTETVDTGRLEAVGFGPVPMK